MKDWVTRLATDIAALPARPCVVAIDGRSGAGKSTLAQALADVLSAAFVEGDDFYAGGVVVRADPADVLARDCIDWRAQRQVLEALKAGQAARYHPFDWDAFDGTTSRRVKVIPPCPVIILEGVYANRTELRDLVDMSVLLVVDDVERERRLVAREGELTAWERQWHRAEDWYFETDARAAAFDLVIET